MKMIGILIVDRDRRQHMVHIQPHWRGKGIAIHKPITLINGEPEFRPLHGYWRLTHISTGCGLGACFGNLARAKGFAMAWDAEFAALLPGQPLAPDRMEAWREVLEEMKREPPKNYRDAWADNVHID